MEYFLDIDQDGTPNERVMNIIRNEFNLFKGKRIRISVEKVKYQRSHAQNAMWWSWMGLLEKETGEDKDILHELFKSMFLTEIKNNPFTGDEFIAIKSSSQLTKGEFSELTEKLVRYCGEQLHIRLPLPPEKEWDLKFN